MSTYPTPAAVRSTAMPPLNLAKLTAVFREVRFGSRIEKDDLARDGAFR